MIPVASSYRYKFDPGCTVALWSVYMVNFSMSSSRTGMSPLRFLNLEQDFIPEYELKRFLHVNSVQVLFWNKAMRTGKLYTNISCALSSVVLHDTGMNSFYSRPANLLDAKIVRMSKI